MIAKFVFFFFQACKHYFNDGECLKLIIGTFESYFNKVFFIIQSSKHDFNDGKCIKLILGTFEPNCPFGFL